MGHLTTSSYPKPTNIYYLTKFKRNFCFFHHFTRKKIKNYYLSAAIFFPYADNGFICRVLHNIFNLVFIFIKRVELVGSSSIVFAVYELKSQMCVVCINCCYCLFVVVFAKINLKIEFLTLNL